MSAESYSVPTPTNNGWLSKRYLGVPVVYLAGAVVAILVIVAYLGSKKNTTGAIASTATKAPIDPYQTLNSTGTVTTSQPVYFVPSNTNNIDTNVVETNASWQRKAIEYLVSAGSSIGDAQGTVQAYITGQSMTYEQGALMNKAVAKIGVPPVITDIGTVANAPDTSVPSAVTAVQSAYANYLGRSGSAAEIGGWTSSIANGMSVDTARLLIYNSPEAVAYRANKAQTTRIIAYTGA